MRGPRQGTRPDRSVPRRTLSIFVSSTMDLAEYRDAAKEEIVRLRALPLMLESITWEPRAPIEVIPWYLGRADAVVLILGDEYGTVLPAGQSFVEFEYELAQELGIPVIALVAETPSASPDPARPRDARQTAFISRVRSSPSIVKAAPQLQAFVGELSAALRALPDHVRADAGSVSTAYYHDALREVALTRALAHLALIHQPYHSTNQHLPVIEPNRGRSAKELLELLQDDAGSHSVSLDFVTNLTTRFIHRLHDFTTATGFAPESAEEFKMMLDALFGASLRVLRATSIHSARPELSTYKGYWEDAELGPFFKSKNAQFLKRVPGGVQRLFVCDSLADAVFEDWFTDAVLPQVLTEAAVKVTQLDGKEQYEDFGIYEHEARAEDVGSYLLLAPIEDNVAGGDLHTRVTPHAAKVQEYRAKFDALWSASPEPLEKLDSEPLGRASKENPADIGTGRLTTLFRDCVILRSMRELDSGVRLLPAGAGFVRKHDFRYAEALYSYVQSKFRSAKRIVYVGDTYRNDGAAMRNLQSLGAEVIGFVCEPELKLDRLWFDRILYSSRWTDLIGIVEKLGSGLGSETLAIFDIDQTLWAPKGVHDGPLRRSRVAAMQTLVGHYVKAGAARDAARARIPPLYEEISAVEYQELLTLDNEDYKAALCIFLALNLVHKPTVSHDSGGREGERVFDELGQKDATEFVNYMRGTYLPLVVDEARSGEENIRTFLAQTLMVAVEGEYAEYATVQGIDCEAVRDAVVAVASALADDALTVKYKAFRAEERKEARRRASPDSPWEDRIVINRPTWELATWLNARGASLMALSDRPDEATIDDAKGESLLDLEMTIHGRGVADYLDRMAS